MKSSDIAQIVARGTARRCPDETTASRAPATTARRRSCSPATAPRRASSPRGASAGSVARRTASTSAGRSVNAAAIHLEKHPSSTSGCGSCARSSAHAFVFGASVLQGGIAGGRRVRQPAGARQRRAARRRERPSPSSSAPRRAAPPAPSRDASSNRGRRSRRPFRCVAREGRCSRPTALKVCRSKSIGMSTRGVLSDARVRGPLTPLPRALTPAPRLVVDLLSEWVWAAFHAL